MSDVRQILYELQELAAETKSVLVINPWTDISMGNMKYCTMGYCLEESLYKAYGHFCRELGKREILDLINNRDKYVKQN